MEKAILINCLDDFKYWEEKYSRIYFGSEFCGNLLPSRKDFEGLTKFISKNKLNFTLLTPSADTKTLRSIKKIFQYSPNSLFEEIVVNDYGVLNYIQREFPNCEIILGRLLARNNALYPGSFFRGLNIKRIEFDSLTYIRKYQSHIRDSFVSYYSPYTVFFATRYCPFADFKNNRSKNHGIINCSKECLKINEVGLTNPLLVKSAVLRGNSLFMKNKITQKELNSLKIDRLVFQPKTPF